FHLWSPWRATALEHRLYEAVRQLPRTEAEQAADEWRVVVRDPKTWRTALQAVSRVLKGWQEEADPGSERRSWRWLVEADTDADGYDHSGERASLDRGAPDEPEKGEDIDLEGFGARFWPENSG